MATDATSVTGKNLLRAGRARVALGTTRDVVMIEGPLDCVPAGEMDAAAADAYVAVGWDPRGNADRNIYMLLAPARIQAWREENEIRDRDIMGDGGWLS